MRSHWGRPTSKLLIDACRCAYCDVLTHGTTYLIRTLRGRVEAMGKTPFAA
ncbi:hypothetical protein SynROS8604_01008 [Synechococcus sp. ROS8604]|nr:hypothetical protein SynROS8604_01008 [Synechococcus sp. ROS8604]